MRRNLGILLIFSLLLSSCLRTEDSEPTSDPSLTITDARAFFYEYEDDLILGGGDRTRGLDDNDPLADIQPNWDEAQYSELLGEEVVEVPFEGIGMLMSVNMPAEEGDTTISAPLNSVVKLIAGLDSYGGIYYRILYITCGWSYVEYLAENGIMIPDLTIADLDDNLTAILRLHNIDGTFDRGMLYYQGRQISTISQKSSGSTSNSNIVQKSPATYDCYDFRANMWVTGGYNEDGEWEYTYGGGVWLPVWELNGITDEWTIYTDYLIACDMTMSDDAGGGGGNPGGLGDDGGITNPGDGGTTTGSGGSGYDGGGGLDGNPGGITNPGGGGTGSGTGGGNTGGGIGGSGNSAGLGDATTTILCREFTIGDGSCDDEDEDDGEEEDEDDEEPDGEPDDEDEASAELILSVDTDATLGSNFNVYTSLQTKDSVVHNSQVILTADGDNTNTETVTLGGGSVMARAPGMHTITASIDVSFGTGEKTIKTKITTTATVTVQFPSIHQISFGTSLNTLWQSTLSALTSTTCREYGATYYINTQRPGSSRISHSIVAGPVSYYTQQASVTLSRNPDSPGGLFAGGTWAVAMVHTHPPLWMYEGYTEAPIGLSTLDLTSASASGLPWVVMECPPVNIVDDFGNSITVINSNQTPTTGYVVYTSSNDRRMF